MKKLLIVALIAAGIWGCSQNTTSEEPDMYEASPLASLMREMVEFSKDARAKLHAGDSIHVPDHFFDLKTLEASRDENEERAFQAYADVFLDQLEGINRLDSQSYYYSSTIDACKSCHSSYCGGPLAIIEQLGLQD